MAGALPASGTGSALPPVLPARVEDAPRLYEQSLRERFESSLRQRGEVPGDRLVSLLALGGGSIAGGIGGALLGRRLGHGLLGGVLGGVLLGGGALFGTLLPNLLREPRDADGTLPRPRLDESEVRALVATETDRKRDTWRTGMSLERLRNAHLSNTAEQLRIALAGDYNSLEGDVRLEHGVPVMSHDRGGEGALLFADWARIAMATGKHLRIDLKEAAAIDQVSALLHQLGVPDGQVTINLSTGMPFSDADAERSTLERIRGAHPGALIGFNVPDSIMGSPIVAAIDAATAIGGQTQVSLAIDQATPTIIGRLRTAGIHVGIWNDPQRDPVDDPASTRRELREMGVDGLVDLRSADAELQL
jgi:hypothetical protein